MRNFPDINVSETNKNDEWIQDYIHSVCDYHEKSSQQREVAFDTIYDSYNGILESKAKSYITEFYGKKSKIPFIRYNYGRTKIKLLLGEMLDIKFDSVVEVANPEAKSKKMKNANTMMGAMMVKEELNSVREITGMNVLNGAEIPDKEDPQAAEKITPKLGVEMFMQSIVNDKIETEKLIRKAYECFTDLTIISECHGIVTRDQYGNDTFDVIPAKEAIFMEIPGDPFCNKSPFHGRKTYMFLHQIMQKFPDLTNADIEQIKKNTELNNEKYMKTIGGEIAYPVYYVEFHSPKPIYTKISDAKDSDIPYKMDLSYQYYDKNIKSIKRDIKQGKYTVITEYAEQIFKGYRIGLDTFVEIGRKDNYIQRKGDGKYHVISDFVHCLFGTVNGTRISIQELVYHLDEMYDTIMFQITRELRKLKGQTLKYDQAATPKDSGGFKSVMFDIVEEGVIRVNTLDEGNYYSRDIVDASKVVESLNLGANETIGQLVSLKAAIEQTIDRITGISMERQGLGMASATATTTTANIEGSRNITKDLFFFLNEFMELVLMKISEKVKNNEPYLKSKAVSIKYGDQFVTFLDLIKELKFYEFGTFLTDGRLVNEIKDKVRYLFNQEVNSGSLRTSDVIRFESAKTMTQGLEILDQGWETIQNATKEQTQSQERMQSMQSKIGIETAREDREDKQEHDSSQRDKDRDVDIYKAELKSKDVNTKIKVDLKLKKEKDKEQSKGSNNNNKSKK